MSVEGVSESAKVPRGKQTPEKADRKAVVAAVISASTEEPASLDAESSLQAQARATPDAEEESGSRKRRRKDEAIDEEEELEIDLEAPMPMSKAEARAAKRKTKRGEVVPPKPAAVTERPKRKRSLSLDDGSADEGKAEGGEAAKKETKIKNSIWIGNLSFKTTQDTLRSFFVNGLRESGAAVGDGSVTRVNLPKKPGHGSFAPNKGFAYVDFETEDLQRLAVGLSERMMEGRKVLIKLGDDHNPTPNARTPKPIPVKTENSSILKNQPHPESSTLFVGNLPFDATEEALRDLIETNADELAATEGEAEETAKAVMARGGPKSGLRKVRLAAFEDTGKCKGFAFLDFLSPSQATVALAKRRNHFYEGRKLVMQYASLDAAKRSGGRDAKFSTTKPHSVRPKKLWQDDGVNVARRIGEKPELSRPVGTDQPAEQRATLYDELSEPVSRRPMAAKPGRGDQRGKKWEAAGRPRPGAALAMAKREKVGIVEAQGSKITFD